MKSKMQKNNCDCSCFEDRDVDKSRRDFIKKASIVTMVGSSAFILEACGGGGGSLAGRGDTLGVQAHGGETRAFFAVVRGLPSLASRHGTLSGASCCPGVTSQFRAPKATFEKTCST